MNHSATSFRPYMIGIVAIPGCGKSTSCSILPNLLNYIGILVMSFDEYYVPMERSR